MSRYKAYPEYRESNIGWMGAVPEGWSIIPCRAVVKDISDKNVGAADQNYLSVMANVGVIKYEDKGDVGNKKPDDLSKCKIVKSGNLVINSMNYAIGSYGMSPYNGVCSPVYIVLGVNQDAMESRFALRIFENTPFQKYLATFGNGILEHRAAIGWDDIKGAHIAVPSKAEQRAILNFLDHETAKIDALIEKQQRLIELLKEKRQAVISHAVTKGLNPNAPMKDSGVEWLGEVPEHWRIYKLKRIIKSLESGVSVNAADTPALENELGVLKTSCVYTRSFRVEENKTVLKEEYPRLKCPIRKGAIIISRMNTPELVGASAVVEVDQENIFLPDRLWQTIFSDDIDLNPQFLGFYMTHHGFRNQISLAAEGASSSMQNIAKDDYLSIHAVLPGIAEQNLIVGFLDQALENLRLLEDKARTAINLMQERRTALISAAVTGKIDVRDWQAAA